MLVPKRETIRSKQLSLPGDKQMAFTGFLFVVRMEINHAEVRGCVHKGEERRPCLSDAQTHTLKNTVDKKRCTG